MRSKKLILTASLMLILNFLVGCTSSNADNSGNTGGGIGITAPGVQIVSFYIDCMDTDTGRCSSVTILPGQPVNIRMEVTNSAEQLIKNVYAELYNIAELNATSTNLTKTWGEIMPGVTEETNWYLKVPEMVTVSTQYQPLIRACFAFKSTGWKDIFFADRDWTGETPNLGSFVSEGPVSELFSWSGSYVPIRGEGVKTIKVSFKKIADGFVASDYLAKSSFGEKDTLTNVTVWWDTSAGVAEIGDKGDFDECHKEGTIAICTVTDLAKLRMYSTGQRDYNVFINIASTSDAYEHVIKLYAETHYKFCVYSSPLTINVRPQIQ